MPALKAHKWKVQEQHIDNGRKFGKGHCLPAFIPDLDSDLDFGDDGYSSEDSPTDNNTASTKGVDHFFHLYDAFRGIEEHSDIETRIKKAKFDGHSLYIWRRIDWY